MECRKQLCEKCKKKEDDYFLVTLYHHSMTVLQICVYISSKTPKIPEIHPFKKMHIFDRLWFHP